MAAVTDSPREAWTITVPARTRWLLNWQKVPTGETESTDTFFTNFTGALKDYNIDDVFTDLVRDAQGRATATLKGRAQQIEVTQGPNYRAMIVYSPNRLGTGAASRFRAEPEPARCRAGNRAAGASSPPPNPLATPNFICIEPMAGITNALNLAHRGVYKELQSIPPGGTWQESFWMRARGFSGDWGLGTGDWGLGTGDWGSGLGRGVTALCAYLLLSLVLWCVPSAYAGQPASRGVTSPSPALAPPAGRWSSRSNSTSRVGSTRRSGGHETGYIRNKEAQFYTTRAENVRAEGGSLVIEARKGSYQGFGYTSASINTLGWFEFLYGRVEVRAKLPTGNGTWPAIWMLGVNRKEVGWPACGEIDIMENVGFDPLRIVGSVHTAAYNRRSGHTSRRT